MSTTEFKHEELNLQQHVNRLLETYQPAASKQQSFFINELPDGLCIIAGQEVLSSLLFVLANSGNDPVLKINTKMFDGVVMLNVRKNTAGRNNYGFLCDLLQLQVQGHHVNFPDPTCKQDGKTYIPFSFINDVIIPAILSKSSTVLELKCA